MRRMTSAAAPACSYLLLALLLLCELCAAEMLEVYVYSLYVPKSYEEAFTACNAMVGEVPTIHTEEIRQVMYSVGQSYGPGVFVYTDGGRYGSTCSSTSSASCAWRWGSDTGDDSATFSRGYSVEAGMTPMSTYAPWASNYPATNGSNRIIFDGDAGYVKNLFHEVVTGVVCRGYSATAQPGGPTGRPVTTEPPSTPPPTQTPSSTQTPAPTATTKGPEGGSSAPTTVPTDSVTTDSPRSSGGGGGMPWWGGVIIGVILGLLAIVGVVFFVCCCCMKRKAAAATADNVSEDDDEPTATSVDNDSDLDDTDPIEDNEAVGEPKETLVANGFVPPAPASPIRPQPKRRAAPRPAVLSSLPGYQPLSPSASNELEQPTGNVLAEAVSEGDDESRSFSSRSVASTDSSGTFRKKEPRQARVSFQHPSLRGDTITVEDENRFGKARRPKKNRPA